MLVSDAIAGRVGRSIRAAMPKSEFLPFSIALRISREVLLTPGESSFASLAAMTAMRTGDNGTYRHAALADLFGNDLFQRTSPELHLGALRDWIKAPFGEQTAVVRAFLCARDDFRSQISETSLLDLAPISAELPDRQVFQADLSIILRLLRVEGADRAAPGDSTVLRLAATLKAAKGDAGSRGALLRTTGQAVDFSPYYLGRAFRAYTGLSFQAYLLAFRMTLASDLLVSRRDLPLRDVAGLLGYNSDSNFCRDFLKAFHKTPTEYRIQVGERQGLSSRRTGHYTGAAVATRSDS